MRQPCCACHRPSVAGGARGAAPAASWVYGRMPSQRDALSYIMRHETRVFRGGARSSVAYGSARCSNVIGHSAAAVVSSKRPSMEAIVRRTCERSQRLRIAVQSAASAALPASKKRVAERDSFVF
jgi:hypothetical protein